MVVLVVAMVLPTPVIKSMEIVIKDNGKYIYIYIISKMDLDLDSYGESYNVIKSKCSLQWHISREFIFKIYV